MDDSSERFNSASPGGSHPGLVDTVGAGTPAASTLTTVSNDTRDTQMAAMRVDRDDWRMKFKEMEKKYLDERQKNKRMTREIAGPDGSGTMTTREVKTMSELGERIGEHGISWLAGLLNWFRYEMWKHMKCMPAGYQNWKPHVQYHCSFYWAAKILEEYGGWPNGMEPVYVWTTWILPAMSLSLNSWRASTIRKFTSLVEGENYAL